MDTAKDDKNKPKLSLVPKDIITNMARAEEYEKQVALGSAPKLITVTERVKDGSDERL